MSDQNPLSDPNSPPEDVATLYSWANLHGAKYRDFSAARAQTREMVRLRAEKAAEEQRLREQGELGEPHAGGPTLVLPGNPEILSAEVHGESHAESASEQVEEAKGPTVLEGERVHAREDFWASRNVPTAGKPSITPGGADEEAAEKAHLAAVQAAENERAEAEERARIDAEARGQAEAEKKAQDEAEERARFEAEVRARVEAELKVKAEAEERARLEAALAKAQADEKTRRDAREAAEREAQAAAERAREEEAQRAEQQAAEAAATLAAEQAAAREAEQAKRQAASAQVQPQPLQSGISRSSFATHAAAQSSSQRGREYASYGQPEKASPDQPQSQLRREENSMPPHTPWAEPEAPENGSRPAWLSDKDDATKQASSAGSSSQATAASASGTPDDTLQGSRDRLASRWFALRGLFEGTPAPIEPVPPPVVAKAPATAIFSLAGGVGKTSLVATLGRALSARGERVLLVDTAAFGLMPFFFGAMDQRPGSLRTFNPPGLSNDAPIQLVTIDPDGLTSESAGQESLAEEIGKFSRGVSRVIVDLATASGATTRRILRMSPLVLVPADPGHEFGGQRELDRCVLRAQPQSVRQAVDALLRAEPVRQFAAAASGCARSSARAAGRPAAAVCAAPRARAERSACRRDDGDGLRAGLHAGRGLWHPGRMGEESVGAGRRRAIAEYVGARDDRIRISGRR